MVDKAFCMSSYLAFRYIERADMDFFEGMHHENIQPVPKDRQILVNNVDDVDAAIQSCFDGLRGKKLGIMLSGGMDSACLASYMRGCDAYTFRFQGGSFQKEELARAEHYARYYDLKLHYVDIDWEAVNKPLEKLMLAKGAPIHSIEPQIYLAAMQAKADGVETMIVGESADLIFGGMDKLLSQDWLLDDFMKRYIFTQPQKVLREPVDMSYLFERYRQGDRIDFLSFMDDVFAIESSSSYLNAFAVANMPYVDPYAPCKMAQPLDLYKVRHGEPKYLVRSLFAKKYPDIPVPDKVPMPRPVDAYFANWKGPQRPEFRDDIALSEMTGNQKWQLYCLERFLDITDPIA